jgi:hypothetical protein
MRKTLLVVGFGIIGFVLLRQMACSAGHAGDEKLARHLDAMCDIAERGIGKPDDGVKRLFRYLGDNAPQMLHDLGDLLVTIERIEDDARHDERARLAHKRLRARLLACAGTWQRFGEAIERDEQASHRLERGMERFGRTIEIIFGERGARVLGETRPLLRHTP